MTKLITKNIVVNQLRSVVPSNRFWRFSERTKNLYFKITKKQNLGWKHSAVMLPLIQKHSDLENICFITLTKNPYSFLLSLYNRPYLYIGIKPSSFSEFIRSKWFVQDRDNYKNTFFETPIDLWNYKNNSYIDLKKKLPSKTYNMTYESLLKDYKQELHHIQKFFNLELKNEEILNYTKSTNTKNVSHKNYQKYYLNEEWKEELKQEDIEFINKHLDMNTMDFFKYLKLQATF